MDIVDFIIGATLMNAMPHFVLGTWNARILSAFGFGNKQNKAYSLLNLVVSLTLFGYKYGIESLFNHGIYVGGLTILVIYIVTGHFWRNLFEKSAKS